MEPLIDAAALATELDRGTVTVLDVQYSLTGPPSTELYAAAHLPGAAHLSLDTALAAPPGAGGRHPLPEPAALERALRACGVDDGDRVVVYDQQSSLAAARAWWVLRWAGLAPVQVLDGGLAAWQRAGGAVSTEPVTPHPGDVLIRPGSLPVVEVDDILDATRTGILLDVRAAERYRGEVEPIDPVAGHIPGAVNLPMTRMQHADGTFRPAAQIRAIAAEAGADGSRPVITSCGSGVTAAQMVLALELAGIAATPFIGSWSAWITDPSRPVATGADP